MNGRKRKTEHDQKNLPFGEAEASAQEQRSLLGVALDRVGCDLYMRDFVLWVYNVTNTTPGSELVKTYAELALSPWGLCCSPSRARSAVRKSVEVGLIRKSVNRYQSRGQSANGYSIDQAGIRKILRSEAVEPEVREFSEECKPGGPWNQGGGPENQTPVTQGQRGGPQRHPYKENSSLDSSLLKPDPEPEDRRPVDFYEKEKKAGEIEFEFGHIPELEEARSRLVDPLPAGKLIYGVFDPLLEDHLPNARSLANWHARQLSTHSPVVGGTEADLLLVLAAGIYAARMPASDIRRNRVAVFCSIVGRRNKDWRKVLRYIPDARRNLDEVMAA